MDYRNKIFFERLNLICEETNLIQLIENPTWKRIINNSVKTSILDHIYVRNPNDVTNIEMCEPLFGDHKLITFEINARPTIHNIVLRRNWSRYSKDKLNQALSQEHFNIETDSVQQTWNLFETALINITESLAPIEKFYLKTKPSKKNSTPKLSVKYN